MSWKRLEDIFARRLEDVLKMSWRRLENVKTYGQDEYIGLDQDASEDEDECLLGTVFKKEVNQKTRCLGN